MLFIALLLFALAMLLFWQARKRRKETGLPAGRVIYSDTRTWGKPEQALYDAEFGLTGKPDYLVEQNGQVIPVEVKSRRVEDAPYDSHIIQLAAYCLLVQRCMHKRPPYGILKYANRTFAIDYTPELERTLLALLTEIRTQERKKELPRSHEQAARCKACGFREICDQRLMVYN
jgi:CRISPR-associated exonuclease Cas4